jgi:hypothetical protein
MTKMPKLTNRYDLELGKRVGPINLGANRGEIIGVLGEPDFSRQDPLDFYNTDYYDSYCIRVDYRKQDKVCVAVDVYDSELIYQGTDLLGLKWPKFLSWMRKQDPSIEESDEVVSKTLGLSTRAKPMEPLKIESICVFSDGYWPTEEEMQAAADRREASTPSVAEMAKELGLEDFF